jgi:hypothetical protein
MTQSLSPAGPQSVFPPALVGLVRERLRPLSETLVDVSDDEIAQLLTTTFFAGLETHEGEHNPVGVVFLGRSAVDTVIMEDADVGGLPLYRWKILRFVSPRPFEARELVKLAVTSSHGRIYVAVGVIDPHTIAITGLAREGITVGPDPFVKIVASRPGCLSIRNGRDLLVEYERGTILTVGVGQVLSSGPLHHALVTIARTAGVDDDVIAHYLDAVAFLVREIVAHGRGGILIISADEHPSVAESAAYRMERDSSLATLLRLAWRTGLRRDTQPLQPPLGEPSPPVRRADNTAFGQLLHNSFLAEAERVVEELGRLTAIDGAVLVNRELALVAFGMILPVGPPVAVVQAADGEDTSTMTQVDISSRGTRHHASVSYAADHPGSVVFVASEDGQVSCLFCERPGERVRLWRLATGTVHIA